MIEPLTPERTRGADAPVGLRGRWRSDEAQDLAEYAILIGLLALVVMGTVALFGGELVALYGDIVDTMPFS